MKKVQYADTTLKSAKNLSFREKSETARNLDKVEVNAIELPMIEKVQADSLLVKTIAASINDAVLVLPVAWNEEGVEVAYAAIENYAHKRLQVVVPISPVGMEYTCHMKPAAVKEMIATIITKAKSLCNDVEFVAEDATRAEDAFMAEIIETAVNAGVTIFTVKDAEGKLMPEEFGAFVAKIKAQLPETVTLGVACSNELGLAEVCSIEAVKNGAEIIKVSAVAEKCADIYRMTNILENRTDYCGAKAPVKLTQFKHAIDRIVSMIEGRSGRNGLGKGESRRENNFELGVSDDLDAVIAAVKKLGYDLSEEDNLAVFEAVKAAVSKKNVSDRELDAIVASTALQVPPAYTLVSYVINAGNVINATANIELRYNNENVGGIAIGDGPIDAAFRAIEQIVGTHYELDDFQIQSVTEGKDAMGEALIRLRANGKLYSGRGISTDVIGASIYGYINALNKIAFEE